MTYFVEVGRVDQIPQGGGWIVETAGRSIALFNVDGAIYALNDSCPHAGASLGAGKIDGGLVACRAHGLKFDLATGRVRGTSGLSATTHPVRVVDGKVLVSVA
jgi:3-phenylpropionate/trans-cinnamate dioxygenase ferredoxin component